MGPPATEDRPIGLWSRTLYLPIIRRAVANDLPTLLDEIDALLEVSADGEAGLEAIERTLTDGYAHALTLDAERWRLERQLGEAAGSMEDANLSAEDLSGLGVRLAAVRDELGPLRSKLSALRAQATALRAHSRASYN
jgi:hypothetical protein